jgi:hypothetical protein
MNDVKMSLRIGSILANVDYQCLKHGSLPPALFNRGMEAVNLLVHMLRRSDDELKEGARKGLPDLVILCGRNAPKTLEEVKTACEIYGVEEAYLDSFYHLVSDRSVKYKQRHEQQLYLSEDIKSMALDLDIPVIGTTQANREAEKNAGEHAADVAGTDALAREVDALYRVIMRRGKDMYEDEYEGYWANQAEHVQRLEKRRAALMDLHVNPKLKKSKGPAIARVNRPNSDSLQKTSGLKVRKSAEIAVIANGNREGVMDGMLLHVVPGYLNQVLRDDFTPREAQEWMKRDDEEGPRTRKPRGAPRPEPVVGSGQGFGSLSKR